MELHHLKLICVTRGCRGSLLITQQGLNEHPGYRIQVADAIGAGDAFTACLAHHYLRGASLKTINEAGNRFAAWVASRPGATPSLDGRELKEALRMFDVE